MARQVVRTDNDAAQDVYPNSPWGPFGLLLVSLLARFILGDAHQDQRELQRHCRFARLSRPLNEAQQMDASQSDEYDENRRQADWQTLLEENQALRDQLIELLLQREKLREISACKRKAYIN
jgi:hypothetical protein